METIARTIDTGTDELLCELRERVAVITLNRPQARNSLSDQLSPALREMIRFCADDAQVGAVMITGAGSAFCAGGDVKGMNESHRTGAPRAGREGGLEDQVTRLRNSQRAVSLALHQFPKPVVAVLPGAAAGAGLSIALAADLRVAAERAVIVTAFANVGASGDFGGSWFLTHLVGTAKAKELYFSSPRLSAREALEIGMVNAVLADDGFEEQALAWCRRIAAGPPIAQRLMKENLNRALVADLATALDAEAPNMIRSMSTGDHREAAAAFVEKRAPVFRGE